MRHRTAMVVFALVTVIAPVLASVLAVAAPEARSASAGRAAVAAERYRPPVEAPTGAPFQPPPEPWSAGHRGLDYLAEPGDLVRAIGPGLVVFAGSVAGRRWVTVRHPDGLRSSVGPLASVGVHDGDLVVGGAVLGRSAGTLHVGVRRGTAYLDPASLWGRPVRAGWARLLPWGDPGSSWGS